MLFAKIDRIPVLSISVELFNDSMSYEIEVATCAV